VTEWGRYASDPPESDVWFFRDHEIALIARALATYSAQSEYYASAEREHALIIWRRLTGNEAQ